jgi:cell wall-associated NlpC family hydrolase
MRKFVLIFLLVALPLAAQEQEQRPGIIERALSLIGVRYRFGGSDEVKGLDCSGFVRRVFLTSVGVELPRSAATQYQKGCAVPLAELQPGDLVFFRNTYKRGISHVGIYLGDSQFIHAAGRRKRVGVDRLDSPYFLTRFAGGRRLEQTRSEKSETRNQEPEKGDALLISDLVSTFWRL